MISSNVGGLPEVNIEGQSWLFIRCRGYTNMVKKINRTSKRPSSIGSPKEQAKKVAKCFDIDTVVTQHLEVTKRPLPIDYSG